MHTAISDSNKSQSSFFNGYVINNFNKMRHYPILKIISVMHNLTNDNAKAIEPLIIYSVNKSPYLLKRLARWALFYTIIFKFIFI